MITKKQIDWSDPPKEFQVVIDVESDSIRVHTFHENQIIEMQIPGALERILAKTPEIIEIRTPENPRQLTYRRKHTKAIYDTTQPRNHVAKTYTDYQLQSE